MNEQANSVGVICTGSEGNRGVAMATDRDSEEGTQEIRLHVRGKWGLFILMPVLVYSHYRIFRRIYSRRASLLSSFRLVKSTLLWRFFRYAN